MAQIQKITSFIIINKTLLLFIAIFVLHVFFRFYELEIRHQFTWDQVDNAWNAKNILVEHRYPLLGMPAKQSTGFFIGPLYYYIVAFFYWLFDLDPIASAVLAGFTSIISFFVLYFVVRRIFSPGVALIALFIQAVSIFVITSDRVQWPVNFIGIVSLLVFYSLYNIIMGRSKYFLLLALVLGFSFHIHFTSVLYFVIIACTVFLIPPTKDSIKYFLLSLPLFAIWFFPLILSDLNKKSASSSNVMSYVGSSYHGIHLRRILQVAKDAFVEFPAMLTDIIGPLNYLFLPLFMVVCWFKNKSKKRWVVPYLILLWFVVPWFIFSVYNGEITNYYFSLTRPFVLIILAYLLVFLFQQKNILVRLIPVILLIMFTYFNVYTFFIFQGKEGLWYIKEKVKKQVERGETNVFSYGAADSYLFYLYGEYEKNKNK